MYLRTTCKFQFTAEINQCRTVMEYRKNPDRYQKEVVVNITTIHEQSITSLT